MRDLFIFAMFSTIMVVVITTSATNKDNYELKLEVEKCKVELLNLESLLEKE